MPLNLVRDRRSARGQVCTFWLSACMCVCVGHDRYYICSTYICGFAAMAYFAMLSGQGWTAIAGCRQFFYARCCTAGLHWAGALDLTRGNDKSWRLVLSEHDKMAGSRTMLSPCPAITMPLIILLLGQVAGADIPSIACTIGASCTCPSLLRPDVA